MSMHTPYLVAISVLHMDDYYTTPHWPREGDKIIMSPLRSTPGGTVGNFACVCGAQGADIRFYDILGDTPMNHELLEDLERYGVRTEPVQLVQGLPESKCIIVLTPNDKTILGAITPKPVLPLPKATVELFRGAAYIYSMSGKQYFFEDPIGTFRDFKRYGAKLVLDAEIAHDDEVSCEFIRMSDILFFNQFGLEANRGEKGEEEFFRELLSGGVGVIVETLGRDGCRVITDKEDFYSPAFQVTVTDPTGAGDTFNASFLHGLMKGWSLRDAAQYANAAAAYCVTGFGGRAGAVPEQTIVEFMKTLKPR